MTIPHPARYTESLLPVFARLLLQHGAGNVLDPMAGTGERIARLRRHGYAGRIVANEIEPEWAAQSPAGVEIHVGDAAAMTWAEDGEFDAVVTSPTYGNGMADSFEARDGSKRNTYHHKLGRRPSPGSTAVLKWGRNGNSGAKYRAAHTAIWAEAVRVLRPGGLFILNCKNSLHKVRGVRQLYRVSEWHAEELQRQGLVLIGRERVRCPGNRFGANRDIRVDHEDVWALRRQC